MGIRIGGCGAEYGHQSMNTLGQFVVFILIYPFLCIMRVLPLSWAEAVGRGVVGFMGPKTRKNTRVLHGLQVAFPYNSEAQNQILARANWRHYGINLAHAIQLDNPKLVQRTDVEGWHHLQRAFDQGKGVFVLSAHVGVWDVICAVIKHRLHPTDTIYRPIDNIFLNRWFKKYRLKVYKSLIVKGPHAGKDILKAIRAGGIVPMMSDQKMWGGIEVPYFRVPALTASGAVVLGAKLQVPVIPIYTAKVGNRFKMVIEPPMPLTGNTEVDTIQMNQLFEKWVTSHPDQYFSFTHNRWG